MQDRWEISSLQAGMLVAGAVAITGHALAASHFYQAGGRDAWLGGVTATPFALLAVWSLHKLGQRFPGLTLVEYLPRLLGYPGYVLAALFVLYFCLSTVFTLRMLTDWLSESILIATPSWVAGGLYMAAVLYAARGGLDVLVRINQFTLPILTFLGFLVAAGTNASKDYGLLLPVLEHGFGPLLMVTGLQLGYFGEMSILAQFHPYVVPRERARAGVAYMIAVVFATLTLIGPMAGTIATMGYRVAQNMPYPTFQHWLMVSFARFFERTDLLAAHQWLAGSFPRAALYLLLAAHGLTKLSRERVRLHSVLVSISVGTVLVSELAFPTKPHFDWFVASVYLPAGAALGVCLPPLLLLLAWLRQRPRQGYQR